MIPLGVLASARVEAAAGGAVGGFLEFVTSSTGTTTRTVTASFGDPASNRNVIIVAHSRYRAPASATIGGVSATLHAAFSDGFAHVAVFSAVVTGGTSGTVTVTHTGGNPEQFALASFAAYGTLTYDSHGTNGTGATVELTAPSDALVIAALTQLYIADWALTEEDYNSASSNTAMQSMGGYAQPASGSYTVTVTSIYTNYGNSALVGVAFTLT